MTWDPVEVPEHGRRGGLWFSPRPERRPIPVISPGRPRWPRLITALIAGALATTLLGAAGDAFGEERHDPARRIGGGHAARPTPTEPPDGPPHRPHPWYADTPDSTPDSTPGGAPTAAPSHPLPAEPGDHHG
ncbi:hypothetical protein ACMA1D_27490 [Streptomyces sp. 796.1]|uniref:hypothetical protein n=1 Tax=Streptomyces sp. 796.1 TaxID=3163029 RepID=UPI0039C9D7CD